MYIKTMLFILVLYCCMPLDAVSQKVDTTYYKDYFFAKKTRKAKKAVMAAIVTTYPDKTTSMEVKTLVFSSTMATQILKGREPYGTWRIRDDSGDWTYIDFNFEMRYADSACSEEFIIPSKFDTNDSTGYVAPVFEDGSGSIQEFFSKHLFYPPFARESNIQGTVVVKFIITDEGIVEVLAILESADMSLDKSAWQCLRNMRFKTPPIMNGQPVNICVELPVSFGLSKR